MRRVGELIAANRYNRPFFPKTGYQSPAHRPVHGLGVYPIWKLYRQKMPDPVWRRWEHRGASEMGAAPMGYSPFRFLLAAIRIGGGNNSCRLSQRGRFGKTR